MDDLFSVFEGTGTSDSGRDTQKDNGKDGPTISKDDP